jgi:hypothetical protein
MTRFFIATQRKRRNRTLPRPKKPSFRQISRHEFGDALFGTFEPDITTAIINGRKPPQLTAQTLMRLTPRLPAGWAEQRKLLGFR